MPLIQTKIRMFYRPYITDPSHIVHRLKKDASGTIKWSDDTSTHNHILYHGVGGSHIKEFISCSAQEQQIWEIISREILNLSLNVKFCISKNMAPFLYVFRTGPCS